MLLLQKPSLTTLFTIQSTHLIWASLSASCLLRKGKIKVLKISLTPVVQVFWLLFCCSDQKSNNFSLHLFWHNICCWLESAGRCPYVPTLTFWKTFSCFLFIIVSSHKLHWNILLCKSHFQKEKSLQLTRARLQWHSGATIHYNQGESRT